MSELTTYEKVMNDPAMLEEAEIKKFTARERSLINAAVSVAERLLGEKDVEIAVEKTKNQFAAKLIRYLQIVSTPIPELVGKKQHLLSSDRPPVKNTIETAIAAEKEKTSENRDQKPPADDEVYKGTSSYITAPAIFIGNLIRGLSPLTIGILIVLVVAGSYSYASHRVSEVNSTYSTLAKAKDELEEKLEKNGDYEVKYNELSIQYKLLKGSHESVTETRNEKIKEIEALNLKLSQKDVEIQKELAKRDASHKAEIKAFTEKFDEQSKLKLAELEKKLESSETELKEKNQTLADARVTIAVLEEKAKTNDKSIEQSNSAYENTNKLYKAEAEKVKKLSFENSELHVIKGFLQDTLRNLDEVFYGRTDYLLYTRREIFMLRFENGFKDIKTTLDTYAIRTDMPSYDRRKGIQSYNREVGKSGVYGQ